MKSLLIHSADLNSVNRNHAYPMSSFPVQEKASFWRKLVSALRTFILGSEFKHYLKTEAEFQASVVRCLNELSRAIDGREERNDDDLRLSLHALERRIGDALHLVRAELAEKQTLFEQRQLEQETRLRTLDSVARGLEAIVSQLSAPVQPCRNDALAETQPQAAPTASPVDYGYLLLENRFRGGRQEITERLRPYAGFFSDAARPVLEIGSGRGELQTVFKEAGVLSYALELDPAMAQCSRNGGFDVRVEDGIEHLLHTADASLGGIIAIQVIEHLTRAQLTQLLRLGLQKVAPGGRVVFETINTESLSALCHNYFRDPSHVWPLHPETMRYLMDLAGYVNLEVKKLSAYPAQAVLQEVSFSSAVTPRWAEALDVLNFNFQRLNQLLYGYQDYCIIAEVPRR